jgi:hypothetical protein
MPKVYSSRIVVHEQNGDRRGYATLEQIAALERAGNGFIVRSRAGKAVRFVLSGPARTFFSASESAARMHDASRTTRPIRREGGQLLGAPNAVQEHIPGIADRYRHQK